MNILNGVAILDILYIFTFKFEALLKFHREAKGI